MLAHLSEILKETGQIIINFVTLSVGGMGWISLLDQMHVAVFWKVLMTILANIVATRNLICGYVYNF